MVQRFREIGPTEERVLTFLYGDDLEVGESIQEPVSIDVTTTFGVDAAPGDIIAGYEIVDNDILVSVAGMTNNTDYHIVVTTATNVTGKVLAIGRTLPVRTSS